MSTQGLSTKAQNESKDRGTGNIVTGETLSNNKTGLHLIDKSTVSQVATDTIDSIAANVITAAAHSALAGDVIRMTAGAASGYEYRVFSTATNTITLENDNLTPAPVGTDTFEILRPTSLTVTSGGEIIASAASDPIEFNLDTGGGAVATTVLEDTGTPTDSRPLPVKLLNGSGDEAGTSTDPLITDALLDVIDVLDTPLGDASTINGSAGAFVEFVASTAAATKAIQISDTGGIFMGVYTGPAASEVLAAQFGPGSDQTIPVIIVSGTRISMRALETTGPSTGFITINFLG